MSKTDEPEFWTITYGGVVNERVYSTGQVIALDEQAVEFLREAGLGIKAGGHPAKAEVVNTAVRVKIEPEKLVEVRLVHPAVIDGAVLPAGIAVMVSERQAGKLIEKKLAQAIEIPYVEPEIVQNLVNVRLIKRALVHGIVRRIGTQLELDEAEAMALVRAGYAMIVPVEHEEATEQGYEKRG